ncbi:hypothetical protein FRC17_008657 [Serendipita sp. 399]|nr:hypothetical protein FRC17_008657 [Serendipita sp. 399]
MGVHPPAPPACMMGKVARPKVPRKGQGTRAKERREQEAAQRAATATLTAMEAAAGFDATLQGGGVEGIMYPYPPTVIEEESVASPSDSAIIAWRPDFSLEGSVSSKSSPTNSWTELVGTNGEHQIDPLDASSSSKTNATATTAAYDALPTSATSANYDYEYDYGVTSFDGTGQGPAIVDDFEFGGMVTQGRFIGAPFHHHHHHPHHQHHQTTTSTTTGANQGPYGVSSMTKPIALPVSGMPPPPQQQQQKQYAHTHAHTYLPMPVLEGGHVATAMYYSAPLPVDASSSANHEYAAAAAAMPAYTTTTAGQVEAQYIFHDMDPMTSASSSSYFDIPTAYAATAEYAW